MEPHKSRGLKISIYFFGVKRAKKANNVEEIRSQILDITSQDFNQLN